MSICCHRVSFIEDHELKGWDLSAFWMSCNLSLSELLDLLSDDLDTSFVTSIELEDSLSVEVRSKQIFGQSKHG